VSARSARTPRQRWFAVGLVLFNVILYGFLVWYVASHYSILVYSRHARSRFAEELSQVRVREPGEPEHAESARFDTRRIHPYVGFKSQPSARGETYMQDEILSSLQRVETNALGHRSPDLGPKGPGVARIAMLGGSVAFQGSRNETTIVAQLAERLRAGGRSVEYVNAGIVSGISNQELGVLVHEILDLEVDLVIALDGFNDIYHILHFNGRVGWPPFRWDRLIDRSDFAIGQRAQPYYPSVPPSPNLSIEKARTVYENYLRNVGKMAAISRAHGIAFLTALQPYRDFEAHPGPGARLGPINLFYHEVADTFARWDREHRFDGHFVSLAHLLASDETRYIDPCHFDDAGNAVVAGALHALVRERGLL
jgi:lysophospholipase L1-like esterase